VLFYLIKVVLGGLIKPFFINSITSSLIKCKKLEHLLNINIHILFIIVQFIHKICHHFY